MTPPPMTPASSPSKPPVLVVDDNAAFTRSLVRLLESLGQPAMGASSAYDAIDWLRENPAIGLVLADVRMPEIDGVDLLRVVRYNFPRVPLALMSAYPVEDCDIPAGIPLLTKPFEVEALIALVPKDGPAR